MRHALRCLGLALGLLAALPAGLAETRQWIDATGKHKIEAEFVELAGGMVKLRNAQGKTLSIALNKLSPADRKVALELAAPAQVADDSAALLNSLVRVIVKLDPATVAAAEGETPDEPEEIVLVGFAIQTGEPGPVIVLSNRNFPRGIDPADIKAALGQPEILALRADTSYSTADAAGAATDPSLAAMDRGAPLGVDGGLDPRGAPPAVPAAAPVAGRGDDLGGETGDEPPRRLTAAEIAAAPLELILVRVAAGANLPALKLASSPTAAGAKALVAKLPSPRVGGPRRPIPWTSWSVLESDDPQREFYLQPEDGQYPYIGATLPVLNDKREVIGLLNPGIKTLPDKRRAATAAGLLELQTALVEAGIRTTPAASANPALLAGGEAADSESADDGGELSVAQLYLLQAKSWLSQNAAAGAAGDAAPPAAADPYGRPAMDTPDPRGGIGPADMADPRGGIGRPTDATGAWRTDYNALSSSITAAPNREGRYDIAWGDAADFGAWYDAARQAATARAEANAAGGRDQTTADRATQLELAAAEALARVTGVTWTATVNSVDAGSGRPSDVALPPLPEPLRMTFFVDPTDAGNWATVQPGATIRFSPVFSLADPGEYPAINVHMTLVEAMQR